MILISVYVLALVVANLLVAWLGPWFSPINAFVFIGLDLAVRDKLHDRWGGRPWKIGLLIVGAGLISYALNRDAGQIAVASAIAFAVAMAADSVVYHWLRDKAWLTRANGSNAAGSLVDSVVFPTIAFGGLMLPIVALQFAAKVFGGAIWAWLLRR